MAAARGRVLDVTRLVLRTGRSTLTGIDRVERAYLREFLDRPEPLFLLMKQGRRQWLLPRSAGSLLEGWLADPAQLVPRVLVERLIARRGAPALAARRLRRMALGGAMPDGVAALLARHLPMGGWYFNTGHVNAGVELLAAVRSVPGMQVAVLVHDTIPLDFPQFSRPHAVEEFGALVEAVVRHADLVICNSAATRDDLARQARRHGPLPESIVAHLGTEVAAPDPAALPEGLPLDRPYFLALGTLEPRKNHALLLDVWDHLHATMPEDEVPRLFLVGRRGWRNEELFARLDLSPHLGRTIHKLPGLPDGAVAALMAGARALLMPSLAEGYGLPVAEAAAMGTPVIAAPLPVYLEFVGDYPVYVMQGDLYSWSARIQEQLGSDAAVQGAMRRCVPQLALKTWAGHFHHVLSKAC
ncbi:glycosyltransferase family 1 protein [Frigidibacter sp.]|uniref:glycosyltransferase family 4 protein n=1 Tax=Frigidibacter sp. TaxID=2586418 RepID=UPI0027337F14|nr:glycosyltransferase family 1 protein [Frigidibacter sp.]MDP3339105.1 glycosyltransferase family 1 protein [Frigidibacter sp.]